MQKAYYNERKCIAAKICLLIITIRILKLTNERVTIHLLWTRSCMHFAGGTKKTKRKNKKYNRLFARSGNIVRNKLCSGADDTVGLSKQKNSYQSSPTFLCFESSTALFASQHNLVRNRWPDPVQKVYCNGTKCIAAKICLLIIKIRILKLTYPRVTIHLLWNSILHAFCRRYEKN